MKNIYVVPLILISLLAAPVFAEGIYLGAEAAYRSASYQVNNQSLESKSALGGGIYAGYKFSPYFAAEIGYRDLGNINYSTDSMQSAANAIQASLMGFYPVTDNFSVLGRLGVARLKETFKDNNFTYQNTSKEKVLLGVGVEYSITKQISVRSELAEYMGDNALDTFTLGVHYKF